MSNKPVLGYWKIRGLGHPIRYLLAYLGVDYEEKIYLDQEEWLADKHNLGLPFPNLPYWIEGDTKLTETRAIMKYLCRTRKPELLGKTLEDQTTIDIVDNFMYDLFYTGLCGVIYNYSEDSHKQYKKTEPLKLEYLSKFFKDKQYVAGGYVSYADFFVYEVLRDLRLYDSKCLDSCSTLLGYMSRVESIPEVKKYMESPGFIEKPTFGQDAMIKL